MKNFFKKLFKVLVVLAIIFALLAVAGFFVLKSMLTDEKVKGYVDTYAKQYLGREVKYDKLSFNFIGISLSNFAISEKSTFASGTFAKADKFIVKIQARPLLQKQIRVKTIGIDGFSAAIVKDKTGKFNFDDIMQRFSSTGTATAQTGQVDKSTGSFDLSSVSLGEFYIKNSSIKFTDLSSKMAIEISDINIIAKNLNFVQSFDTTFKANINYAQDKMNLSLPVSAIITANLQKMDLAKASVDINSIKTKFEGVDISGNLSVQSFTAPKISAALTALNISNTSLKQFSADLPKFQVDKIDLATKINANLDKSIATIESLTITANGNKVSLNGTVNWGGKDFAYNITAAVDLVLDSLSKIVPDIVDQYALKGNVSATANITQNSTSIKAKAQNVAFKYDPMFEGRNFNATVDMPSFDYIKLTSLTGALNGKNLSGNAYYKKTKTDSNITLNLNMDGLIIKEFPKSASSSAGATASKTGSSQQTAETPLNINANIKTGEIQIPNFYSRGAVLYANLIGVTEKLNKTNGTITFDISSGTIQDVDKLASANKITKIIFTSVSIVSKVSKTLKIPGFGDGAIQYDNFIGNLTFLNGKMTVNSMDLLSQALTLKTRGTADFAADKLNLSATVTPGNNKPVIMKIGGTVSNPKGSLDVASSIVSIFGADSKAGKIAAALGGSAPATDESTGTVVNASTVSVKQQAVNAIFNLLNKK